MYVVSIPEESLEFYKFEENNIILKNLDHFILFFLLGVLAQQINLHLVLYNKYIFLAIFISFFIEFTHIFLSYRGFELIDLFFNISGCLFGIISLYYIKKYYGKTFN